MKKVIVHIKNLDKGNAQLYESGVPIDADDILTMWAEEKTVVDGIVAVTFVEEKKPAPKIVCEECGEAFPDALAKGKHIMSEHKKGKANA